MMTTHVLTPNALRSRTWRLGELQAALSDLVEETQGEVTETVAELEALIAEEGEQTLEALCWLEREATAMAEAVKAESERLAEVGRRAKARKVWAREQMRELLVRRGVKSAKAGTFTVRRDPGSKSLVGDGVPELLPERFRRVKVEADKKAIGDAIKAGEEVEGYRFERGPEKVVIK